MTEYTHYLITYSDLATTTGDFGVSDDKGRKLGYEAHLYSGTSQSEKPDQKWAASRCLPFPDNNFFAVFVQQTRDGKRFGSSQRYEFAVTRQAAEALIAAKIARAQKVNTKKWGQS